MTQEPSPSLLPRRVVACLASAWHTKMAWLVRLLWAQPLWQRLLLVGMVTVALGAGLVVGLRPARVKTHATVATQSPPSITPMPLPKSLSVVTPNTPTVTPPVTPTPTSLKSTTAPSTTAPAVGTGQTSGTSGGSTGGTTGGGGGGTGTGGTPAPTTPYVQPGTQGYRGSMAALVTYSAANGQVPPGASCAWNQTFKYLRCNDTNLTLDHAYVQGGLYWAGCGSLTLTNSVFDWYPNQSWFDVYNACTAPNAGATITATNVTFQTSPDVIHYTGGSDIGGIAEYTGDVPMTVSHSLVQGFSQGFDPGAGSVISSTEIYVQDNVCNGGGICHGDGLFSQGGNNIVYQDNYIVSPADATSAIFYQSVPNSTGNSVVGNYLQGGSYALYNENSNGVVVQNNTFGGSTYGNCSLSAGASWGVWSGNVTIGGAAVVPNGSGCT